MVLLPKHPAVCKITEALRALVITVKRAICKGGMLMTSDQIEYWKLQETKRNHMVVEDQNERSIAETIRSHQANEGLILQQNIEQGRHNLATELLGRDTLTETIQHNRNVERLTASQISLGYAQLAETQRSNLAREKETHRSNLISEQLRKQSNYISQQNINELSRHNLVSEKIDTARTVIQGVDTASNVLHRGSQDLISFVDETRKIQDSAINNTRTVVNTVNDLGTGLLKMGKTLIGGF